MARQFNSAGSHLGHRYFSSPIIIPDGTLEPPDDLSNVIQSTWPGSRAPHAWLENNLSTLDWFGGGFVLFFTPESKKNARSIEKHFKKVNVPITLVTSDLPKVRLLYEAPLVLIRPDGHVAWRSDTPPKQISSLVNKVSGWE